MSENNRIALFTRYLTMGGIQKNMMKLANEFVRRGYSVDIVLAKEGGEVKDELIPGVRIVDLNSRRMIGALPGLTRYINSNKPAAILSGEQPSNFIALWSKMLSSSDTKFVISVHQNMTLYSRTVPFWYRRMIPALIRIFYPLAHLIVPVSRGIGEDLLQFSPNLKSKTKPVYNPVIDETIFEKADEPVTHPWFSPDYSTILAVGRLSPEKNFGLLIRSFARIHTEIPDLRVIILGDGVQKDHLKELADKQGVADKVDFKGFVKNPYAYMARADVFVLSSIFEGLPTALIESLACGCPVVSTNCPSGPDEILKGGEYGKLVPVNDEEALAAAIKESLSEHHEKSVLRKRAEDFSVQNSVDQYLDIFFEDISNNGSFFSEKL